MRQTQTTWKPEKLHSEWQIKGLSSSFFSSYLILIWAKPVLRGRHSGSPIRHSRTLNRLGQPDCRHGISLDLWKPEKGLFPRILVLPGPLCNNWGEWMTSTEKEGRERVCRLQKALSCLKTKIGSRQVGLSWECGAQLWEKRSLGLYPEGRGSGEFWGERPMGRGAEREDQQ